jgi:hypothetical protein
MITENDAIMPMVKPPMPLHTETMTPDWSLGDADRVLET